MTEPRARKPKPPPSPERLAARATGVRGESIAAGLAESRGWQVMARNLALAGAEADLVCVRQDGNRRRGLLIEVKASRSTEVDLAQRLGPRQQQRLWRMAEVLSETHGFDAMEIAVVLVTIERNHERAVWLELEPF